MHRFLNIQQNIKLRNYHQLLLYFVAAAEGRAEVRRRGTGTGKRSGRNGRSRSRRGSRAAAAVTVTFKANAT